MPAPVGTGRAIGVATTVQEFDGLSTSTGSTVGFFGVTRVVQPASSDQAALVLTTSLQSGFGFRTSAAFNAFIAQLENIRASLVLLGLLKGSA